MLDAKYIITNPDAIKKDLKKRGDLEKAKQVDELAGLLEKQKLLKEKNEKIRQGRNTITREINELKKAGKDIKAKLIEAKELPAKLLESDKKLEEISSKIITIQQGIPNILHESVPIGKDDSENKEIKKWGTAGKAKIEKSHGELLQERGLADFDKASEISGTGFHYLKGELVKLELALINFAIEELSKKGFTPVEPPFIMRREPYEGVVALEDFENVMYKIDGEDSYLIATSEHPIAAMHSNEVFEEKQLPLKYAGISTCFRREIGSHGVDTRGLFRVHQFQKVEMFVFSKPEESWKIHEELLKIAEEIVQKLAIPYRVVNVCSGDIGMIAAKKYDIEGWFPRQEKYRELISCSNCTSYQSVSLNIRFRNEAGEKEFVHTLNSTAIAIGRMITAIIENFGNEDGTINVPPVLQKHIGKKKI